MRLSATPAHPGRSFRSSHQDVATAAATSAPGWPTMIPNATGKTPSSSARCAARTIRPGGASRYQVQPSAASSSNVQTTSAGANERTSSGVTSQANGGGEMNGCGLNPVPRLSIAAFWAARSYRWL